MRFSWEVTSFWRSGEDYPASYWVDKIVHTDDWVLGMLLARHRFESRGLGFFHRFWRGAPVIELFNSFVVSLAGVKSFSFSDEVSASSLIRVINPAVSRIISMSGNVNGRLGDCALIQLEIVEAVAKAHLESVRHKHRSRWWFGRARRDRAQLMTRSVDRLIELLPKLVSGGVSKFVQLGSAYPELPLLDEFSGDELESLIEGYALKANKWINQLGAGLITSDDYQEARRAVGRYRAYLQRSTHPDRAHSNKVSSGVAFVGLTAFFERLKAVAEQFEAGTFQAGDKLSEGLASVISLEERFREVAAIQCRAAQARHASKIGLGDVLSRIEALEEDRVRAKRLEPITIKDPAPRPGRR